MGCAYLAITLFYFQKSKELSGTPLEDLKKCNWLLFHLFNLQIRSTVLYTGINIAGQDRLCKIEHRVP
jgi:hypothetical protein